MLRPLNRTFPSDKKIAGVHSIPITEDGSIIMVWDKNEKALTTVGGRIEVNEDMDTALNRETIEEAGLILESMRVPTARQIISKIEGPGLRLDLLEMAEPIYEQFFKS